jgi:hypothetical protein
MFMQSPEIVQPLTVDLDTVAIIHNEELSVSVPRSAAWSPASDTLAFVDHGIYLAWPSADWAPLKIKNDAPSELKWSPDGKKLAYFVNQFDRDEIPLVVVIDVPSGRTLLIINAEGRRDLCWRNSNDICLRDEEGGKWRRFRVAQDSTVVQAEPSVWMTASERMLIPPVRVGDPLGVNIKTFQIPGLEPAGLRTALTYDVCKNGSSVLVRAFIDSLRRTVVLRNDQPMIDLGTELQPNEFSPDCMYVVGNKTVEDGHSVFESDLWIVEPATLREVRLTESAALEFEPVFSRYGRYLAYRMEKNNASFLVVTSIVIGG